MNNAKPTPGPWYVFNNGTYLEIRTERGSYAGEQIGDVCASKHIGGIDDNPVAALNAHLFAAAPEMFDLLQMIRRSFGGGNVITFSARDIDEICAVIAKARGKA